MFSTTLIKLDRFSLLLSCSLLFVLTRRNETLRIKTETHRSHCNVIGASGVALQDRQTAPPRTPAVTSSQQKTRNVLNTKLSEPLRAPVIVRRARA